MTDMQSIQPSASLCRLRLFFLAFIWCLSFSIGIVFAYFNQNITVSLMCTAPLCRVSIFGLVITLLFPLLITAVAVHFSIPHLIFPIVIFKGISFGYCLFGSFLTFGSASWLVYSLLTFSETVMVVPLLWLWVVYLCGSTISLKRKFTLCVLAALMLGIVDYFMVSPYLATLMF